MDLKVVISLLIRLNLSPSREEFDMEKSLGITLTIAFIIQ